MGGRKYSHNNNNDENNNYNNNNENDKNKIIIIKLVDRIKKTKKRIHSRNFLTLRERNVTV